MAANQEAGDEKMKGTEDKKAEEKKVEEKKVENKKVENKPVFKLEKEAAGRVPSAAGSSRNAPPAMRALEGNLVRINMPPDAAAAIAANGVFIRMNTDAVASAVASAIQAGNNKYRRRRRRRNPVIGTFSPDDLAWMISHYFVNAVLCLGLAVTVMMNCQMQGFVKESSLFLWLLGVSCYVMSMMVERMRLDHTQLYSNLFSGIFLSCMTVLFSVYPPLGLFSGFTILVMATVTTNFGILFCMIKTIGYELRTGRRICQIIPFLDFDCCGELEDARRQNTSDEDLGLMFYVGIVAFIPIAVFTGSQMLYIGVVGIQYDVHYAEFSANVLIATVVAIIVSLERFGFMYRYIQVAMKKQDKMEMAVRHLMNEFGPNNNGPLGGMNVRIPAEEPHLADFTIVRMTHIEVPIAGCSRHATL